MKWTYTIPQKFKAALLLMVIVTTVLIASFWGNSSVEDMNKSFTSVYEDRLLPANELFHINDIMYQKRLLLKDYIDGRQANDNIRLEIAIKNHQIDSILTEYDKTYLVAEETRSYSDFKSKMKAYNKAESDIIHDPAIEKYEELIPMFNDIRSELITLSQIQTTVGKELLNGSEEIKANASLVHYLQLAIIVVLILIVQAIILSAKSIIPKSPQKFQMN